jgi:hypothetical protein
MYCAVKLGANWWPFGQCKSHVAKRVSHMHRGCSASHKWLDTCLSCGKSHHVVKEPFSPFAHSSSEHEKERREEKKGRKERKRGEKKREEKREKRKKEKREEKEKRERKGRKRKEKYENSKVIFSYPLWYFYSMKLNF